MQREYQGLKGDDCGPPGFTLYMLRELCEVLVLQLASELAIVDFRILDELRRMPPERS